jgi:hypothetical protein
MKLLLYVTNGMLSISVIAWLILAKLLPPRELASRQPHTNTLLKWFADGAEHLWWILVAWTVVNFVLLWLCNSRNCANRLKKRLLLYWGFANVILVFVDLVLT